MANGPTDVAESSSCATADGGCAVRQPPANPAEEIRAFLLKWHVRPDGQLEVPEEALDALGQRYGWGTLAAGVSLTVATGSGSRDQYSCGLGHPLPYPFKRLFLGPAATLFRNLRAYRWEDRVAHAPYTSIPGLFQRTALFRPFHFDGRPVRIVARPADYHEMDVLTDLFTEEPRLRSRRLDRSHCPLDHWELPHLNVAWIRTLLLREGRYKFTELSSESLRETMAYHRDISECTQFKPTLGISIIRLLQGRRVLDFSSGWGDRLVAAIASGVERYVGVDPNPDLQPGYRAIIQQLADDPGRYTMVQAPFQTALLPPGETFNLVFTSPPYFNFELYSNPVEQSAREDTDLTDWLEHFLFPALQKAWAVLEDGGHMAIHIVDINARVGAFTETMNLFIQACLPGAEYRGVVCADGGDSGRLRPVWVWRK
eukprot:EG_transcript_13423